MWEPTAEERKRLDAEFDAFIHEREPWMDDVDGHRLPDIPPLKEIPRLDPYRPRWYVLFDWQTLPEGKPEHRPLFMGYLGVEDNESMHAQLLGRRPRMNGRHYLYVCKLCGKVFTTHRSPQLMRRPDCGCAKTQFGRTKTSQTMRLEGMQFGWLIVVEYVHGDWSKGEQTGWSCVCLGKHGNCQRTCIVPTARLKQLFTLACPVCCPEDWETGKRGARPVDCTHTRILREHRARVGNPQIPRGRPKLTDKSKQAVERAKALHASQTGASGPHGVSTIA